MNNAFTILRVRFQHLQNGMDLILPYIIPSVFTHYDVSSDQYHYRENDLNSRIIEKH